LKANRRNAKLGGIKSSRGKEVSKFNSLKHGILSSEVVINRGNIKENLQEFENFQVAFYQDLKPVGSLEEFLVDQMVATGWKMKRILRTENGIISENADYVSLKKEITELKEVDIQGKMPGKTEALDKANLLMFSHIVGSFQGIKQFIAMNHYLNQWLETELTEYFYDENEPWVAEEIIEINLELSKAKDCTDDSTDIDKNVARIIEFIDREAEVINQYKKRVEDRKIIGEKAGLGVFLSSPELSDTLCRYQTSTENRFFRALEQFNKIHADKNKMGSFGKNNAEESPDNN
jgi:hypothetical protein